MRRFLGGSVMGPRDPGRHKLATASRKGVGCEPMLQSDNARTRAAMGTALACYVFLLGAAALIVVTPIRALRPLSSAASAQAKAKASSGGRIVFTGSSSIAYWDSLESDMKPLAVVNSAFGGAQYTELLDQLDELVIAYRPVAVVVYAGDNDLAAGSRKTARSVADDVRQFVEMVHSQLPDTWIYVMSIKPSTARWGSWHKMKDANQLIEEYLRTQERTQYIDVAIANVPGGRQSAARPFRFRWIAPQRQVLCDVDFHYQADTASAVWDAQEFITQSRDAVARSAGLRR